MRTTHDYSETLNDVVDALFRVSLILSGINAPRNDPVRRRMQTAVDEMDRLIHDIRQTAFDHRRHVKVGRAESTLWLNRMQVATRNIDDVLDDGAARSSSEALDFIEASHAAHKAIVALSHAT